MLSRKRDLRFRPVWKRIVDFISSSSWLWGLLEGGSPQARQLSADSIAISRNGRTRRHPTILSTQPDSRMKRCRSKTAPATHQDQGDEDLHTRSPAPGATWRPRKSSSSADRIHKVDIGLWAVHSDAITSWLTADAQINRWMNPPEQVHSLMVVFPAPILAPAPAHFVIQKPFLDQSRPDPS